ncbi:MAG: response regulator [Treponema sp.]|nr:response regulator [Treponema sp.]
MAKDITEYEANKDKKYYLIMAVLSVLALVFEIIHGPCVDHQFFIGGDQLMDYLEIVPVAFLTSLCGYIPALAVVVLTLFYRTFTTSEIAFSSFVLLLASILFYIPARCRWYKKVHLLLLFVVGASVIFGPLWKLFCVVVLSPIPHHIYVDFFEVSFFNALFVVVPVVLLLFLFFTFAPESVKMHFYVAVRYSHDYDRELELTTPRRRSKLRTKILAFIVIEAVVLCTACLVFANLLFSGNGEPPVPFPAERGTDITSGPHRMLPGAGLALNLKLLILLVYCVVPIVVVMNYFVQKKIAKPIKKMADYLRAFARTDETNRRIYAEKFKELKIRSHDEIAELYHSIDITMIEVNTFIDALREEQKLAEDLRVSMEANKAKSNFLSNMSHEIRTPINAVLGFDEMILRESSDHSVLGYANNIKNAGKVLLNLVNDILDFSKIEAGKMNIMPVRYELGALLKELVDMISVRIKEKNLEFVLNVNKTTPSFLLGDEQRIRQVTLNILTNAVKYTDKGSVTLSVDWERYDDENVLLKIHVTDTGIGIKTEDMGRMFRPFERVDESRNRTIEGTGLGMSIITGFLKLMNSSLEVRSEYGKGSTFGFRLRQKVENFEGIGDFAQKYQQGATQFDRYHEQFRAPNAKVLVVDDTKMNLTVFCGLLKNTQIQIDTADGGYTALDMMCQKRYDVIFIDHRMPGLDGIETLHAIQYKKENKNQGVPCIALTANAIYGAREMYLEEGFTNYLSKPIDSAELERMLLEYIPRELVTFVDSASGEAIENPVVDEGAPFRGIEGVDVDKALGYCGSAEVLSQALKDFYANITQKSAEIEHSAEMNDFKNYTILVHALKSSARLIGATQLSDQAAALEKFGDDKNIEEIVDRTPQLLVLYRSYERNLSQYMAQFAAPKDRPLISDAELQEALQALTEFVQAYDYISADDIILQLEQYSVPQDFAERYERIKQLLRNVDRESLLDLLGAEH